MSPMTSPRNCSATVTSTRISGSRIAGEAFWAELAAREGTLRKQMILEDGYQRDTVMYSILDAEWPGVRARFEAALAAGERP